MGCDIHSCYEAYVPTFEPTKQFPDSWPVWKHRGEGRWDRCYELFHVLANVRAYLPEVEPISDPRGLPDDCNAQFEAYSKSWEPDGHSHSWVTLAELKAYDQDVWVHDKSLVCSKGPNGEITGVCSYSTGTTYGIVGWRKLFRLFDDNESRPTPLDEIISDLEKIKADHNIEDDSHVRMVFFFDN